MKSLRVLLIGFALAVSASSLSGCTALACEPDPTEVVAVKTSAFELEDSYLYTIHENGQSAEVEACMSSAIPDLQVLSFGTAYPLTAREAPRVGCAAQGFCFTIDRLAHSQTTTPSTTHPADRPKTFNPFLHYDPGNCR